ncbi:MAG: hypothetical protein E6Q84_01580 [Thiothrix sp.]|nr:MAG: hypothetical protein E6Q84_01580 [Thiothrix sp.]
MATLGETAIVARKAIKFGAIGLVFLMIGRVIVTSTYTYWKSLHPDPPPPPDVKFGKLPKLVFPQKEMPSLQYSLETRTGGVPTNLPTQFTVYFMPIKKPSLLAYDAAKSVANRLDFISEPVKLSEDTYRWETGEPIPSAFTINIITGAFIMDRRWQIDPSFSTPNLIFNNEQAQDRVNNILSRLDLLPDDIKEGEANINDLKADKDQIVSAVSRSQANFVRVNLYRKPINNIPVVYPKSDRGPISVILALQRDEDKQFINIDYNYYPVELETSAVYPIITPTEAWKRLQNGGGYIVNVKQNVATTVVRDITIEYYDAEEPQQYLQPVYVFRGDNDFVAYVPALSDAWVE